MRPQAELARELRSVRKGAGLFRLGERGVLEVGGSDRMRWLDGMISADVAALTSGAGAQGLLLTRQGRIVADLYVLSRSESFWLELEASALPEVREHLARFVIADDVTLDDRHAAMARFALEGPLAERRLAAAGADVSGLAACGWREVTLAAERLTAAAYSLCGGTGFQLFVPVAAADAVQAALLAAGCVAGSSDTLECLRVAAGVPWLGRELDQSVLPAEARLEAAISNTKGCYTGQEVVTRMRSRGRVGHLLVGLRLAGETLPAKGAEIRGAKGPIGQLTSSVLSPELGAIALGFVKADAAQTGADVQVAGGAAQIVELPMRSGG